MVSGLALVGNIEKLPPAPTGFLSQVSLFMMIWGKKKSTLCPYFLSIKRNERNDKMTSAHPAEECQLSPGEVGRAPEGRIAIAATGAAGVQDVSSSPCGWITASANHCRDAHSM